MYGIFIAGFEHNKIVLLAFSFFLRLKDLEFSKKASKFSKKAFSEKVRKGISFLEKNIQ